MKLKSFIAALCLAFASFSAMAQSDAVNFREITNLAFSDYYKAGGVHEKLYLVTDKSSYSAGDNIYFSAFLLNPVLFTPSIESAFMYIELISADGRLITRLKVHGEQGRFANMMPLSTKLDAGRYTLRAYTKWMSNFDKEYLFSKVIEVGNYIDDAIQTQITYTAHKDDSIVARIKFSDDMGYAISDNHVEYTLNLRGKSKVYGTKTNDEGCITFKFRPSEDSGDCMRLRITANSRVLERTFQLPSFSDNFAVQFMPEGGNLIAGVPQIVAFKAIGLDGKSVEVTGFVNDKNGEKLCDITSLHKGMGSFVMTAKNEGKYTATVTSASGVTRTFELPAVMPSGCTLQAKQIPGNILLMKVMAKVKGILFFVFSRRLR